MASFEQHCQDCERLLGGRYEEVNLWLDELFRVVGPMHRSARHHWDGVREAGQRFGAHGAKAAIIHIIRDCSLVPDRQSYIDGTVDSMGVPWKAPEAGFLYCDSPDETTDRKFRAAVEIAWVYFSLGELYESSSVQR